jgi:2-C-methyl-D-erythritol 2,4-cyclodiphosphate synthase
MIKKLANALEIDDNRINIKATTEEGLGFTGSGEGIASQSICLITKK